jgi:hypothetical protein
MFLFNGLIPRQAVAQLSVNISMDLVIVPSSIRVENITQLPCGMNAVTITFDIDNKIESTNAQCEVEFKVNEVPADFTILSPSTCQPNIRCFQILPRQVVHVRAKAIVKNEWVGLSNLKISANGYNGIDGSTVSYHEINPGDNTIVHPVDFSNVLTAENSYCICSNPGTSQVDVSALYVIQGYITKPVGPLAISSASIAVPFNLRPSLTQGDAARFKFRFIEFFNGDQKLPVYTIELSGSGIFLTRDNNALTFRASDNSNNQKWLLKSNNFGGYGIFSIKESNKPCVALGISGNSPPQANSPLSISRQYNPSHISQHFTLVKLQ